MSAADEVVRPLVKSRALRFVFWISVLYLVIVLFELAGAVGELVTDLRNRSVGISWTWDPAFPAPQPAGGHFFGGPYVVPGSTATFTQITGTVANLPVGAIVMRSAGDIAGILASAGIALCLIVLMNRMAAGIPFARASYTALVWLAGIVLVGFEAVQILHGSATIGANQVMIGAPAMPDGVFASSNGTSLVVLWPIYVAAALLTLAAVFRVGAAYREDSEGLV